MKKIIEKIKKFPFKGTVILFLIFIVLLVVVLKFEKNKPQKAEKSETESTTFQVWDINKDDIQKINIKLGKEEWEIVKNEPKCKPDDKKCKENIQWFAKKPKEFEVKKEKVEEILNNFATLSGEKKMTPDNLADFGLAKPNEKLKFTTRGNKTFELFFGTENPDKTKIYTKRSDENYIFLIDKDLKKAIEISESKIKK